MKREINHVSQLIDVNKGNSSKYEQGSWIHPDLGYTSSTMVITKFCFTSFSLDKRTPIILFRYSRIQTYSEK